MTETSSGGMAINECLLQLSVESLPFGGVGASGMGSYHGKVKNVFKIFRSFAHYNCLDCFSAYNNCLFDRQSVASCH